LRRQADSKKRALGFLPLLFDKKDVYKILFKQKVYARNASIINAENVEFENKAVNGKSSALSRKI
jgi:hypothetical protein